METMKINGVSYPVIGQVKRKNGETVPMLDIPMMSDEKWNKMCEENARKHFREWYGREAKTAREAFDGEKAYIEKHWGVECSAGGG